MAKESIKSTAIIEMAMVNSKYNTRKSSVNRKWTRYLKNKKLFDEYMVYLSNNNAAGAEPHSYKQLSNLCHNLNKRSFYVEDEKWVSHHIKVDWVNEFYKFAWKSIKWYDIKNVLLYWINGGYK